MNNPVYVGSFKDHIKSHVELKQAIGYKYNAESGHLKRFDRFTLEKYPEATILTKEIVLEWCRKKTYEVQKNRCLRVSVIREFGKYLDSSGIKAYIIPKSYYPAAEHYMPYIYTVDELARFFAKTDQCPYSSYEYPYRPLIMPLIFRMIYMCGLRLSEARLLKVGDVDLEKGVLTIHHSKRDNSRLIPMADYLTELCRNYSAKVHPYPIAEDYYFPALDGKPMTEENVYINFRRFLRQARISHGGRGCGPRIHDLRHTYAVRCLKKWTEQGKDLTAYLPVLKTYMGHKSFRETVYYLRMTADVFPNIILKIETQYPEIIPELEGNTNETY